MTVPKPSFPDLVAKADNIARVQITDQSAQWDTTPTGHKVIHTYVSCLVLKSWKGTAAAGTTLKLRFLGGEIDGQGMEIPDMPKFVTGRRYIVFVADNGTAFCPLVGVMHGKFTVTTDASGAERLSESGQTREAFENAIVHQLQPAASP